MNFYLTEFKMDKKTSYCNAAFSHTYIDNNKVTPCCWWRMADHPPAKNVKEMFDSPYMQKVRQGMLNGEPLPKNCVTCSEHEAQGGKSHRQIHNDARGFQAEPRLETMEINLGNLCNLACVTCGSYNSSKWYDDEQQLYGLAKGELFSSFGDRIVENASGVEKSFKIEQLSWDILKNLKTIKLAGGEILMMPQHLSLIKKFIKHYIAKNIRLVYIVNLMHDPYKFKNYWKHFERVHIIMSIDGIGDVAEYVRYHSDWKTIEKNIQKYFELFKENNNYLLSTNTVVSVLNIAHLVNIHEYWNFLYIKNLMRAPMPAERGMFRILSKPDNLHIKHIPDEFRKELINNLETVQHLEHIAQRLRAENPTKKWNKFTDWIERLDTIRGNNFYDINPQFKP